MAKLGRRFTNLSAGLLTWLLMLGASAGAAAARADPPPAQVPDRAAWPQAPKPRAGSPNVLVIMTDDVGFGASSVFGGPIPTPTLQSLADRGLRYTNFHTTALCSPSRAALLTGRNPHAVGMGFLPGGGSPAQGYNSVIPKSAGTIAHILRDNGWNTAMFGKAHVTPLWEISSAGPFDRWPTGLGFEHFYGFMGGLTDQWHPTLYEGTRLVDTTTRPDGYILDRDLADKTIEWLRAQRIAGQGRPWFLYYAPGSAHSPHQAPADWIARFKGAFDRGWDAMREETLQRQIALGIAPPGTKLAPRPANIPAWEDLNDTQKRFYARQMEVYAAMLAFGDAQIARVLTEVEAAGQMDNTFVIFIEGDNGATGEGGANGSLNELAGQNGVREHFSEMISRLDELGGPALNNLYPAGWGFALNTPFPGMKQFASHLGGIRNGMVVSWPDRIKQVGETRPQFGFIADIMPTILANVGIKPPATRDGVRQQAVTGVDLSYSFDDPSLEKPRTQYFAMVGHAGLYQDGWMASTTPLPIAWNPAGGALPPPEQRQWELYDLTTDFSQTANLAEKYPERLAAMKRLFVKEAGSNQVLPMEMPRLGSPMAASGVGSFSFIQGMRLPRESAPETAGHSFRIRADIDVPNDGGEGVLLADGGRFGGYALYLREGRPVFHYNLAGIQHETVTAARPLTAGRHLVEAELRLEKPTRGSGGTLRLSVDGDLVGTARVARTAALIVSLDETLDVGLDSNNAVDTAYTGPFRFNGRINTLTLDIEPKDAAVASE